MKIKVDLHIHSEKSFDSNMSQTQIEERAVAQGLTAIAICDHDVSYAGNGGKKVIIIAGVEYSTEYGHVLGLFLDGELPVGICDFHEAVKRIKSANGIVVLAHPYQKNIKKKTIDDKINSIAQYIDGIEVNNSRANYRRADANICAMNKAKQLDIMVSAGSDAHLPEEIGNMYLEMDIDEPISIDKIKQKILKGDVQAVGKTGKAKYIGKSQIIKVQKKKKYGKIIKTFLFYIWCVIKDLKERSV